MTYLWTAQLYDGSNIINDGGYLYGLYETLRKRYPGVVLHKLLSK